MLLLRPIGLLTATLLPLALSGLSDYGGDVSQYMSLLQGSSAFSFKPSGMMGGPKDRRGSGARTVGGEGEGAMKDFGGDYGDYLKLLEGNSALGFNPQSDPIADNQDLQSDVFGGGMSGKFWDMYKGKTSYDTFEESDAEIIEEMDVGGDDEMIRQAEEEDQPEDRYDRGLCNSTKKVKNKDEDESVIIAYKPNKDKLKMIYSKLKKALGNKDKVKVNSILESLDSQLMGSSVARLTRGALGDESGEDEDEKEDQSRMIGVKRALEQFVKEFKTSVPDPVTTSRGLSMNFKNLTLFGITDLSVCGAVKKQFGSTWKTSLCLPRLSAMVDTQSGPGVPFKGKVSVIFKQVHLVALFRQESDSSIHMLSIRTEAKASKYVPTYDSSVPLNPWSKVSMSGYMVSRVKRTLPRLVDKTILKMMHVLERMQRGDEV